MAQLAQQRYDLSILTLSMERTDLDQFPRGQVAFNLTTEDKTRFEIKVNADELGLPMAQAYLYQVAPIKIPEDIKRAFNEKIKPGTPLWMQFKPPYGNLPLIPWEHQLQPLLKAPILRLPYIPLQPITSQSALEVVLCINMQQTKETSLLEALVKQFVESILRSTKRHAVIHIFTDTFAYSALKDVSHRIASTNQGNIYLYDPQQALSINSHEIYLDIENHWFRWIRDTLSGRSIDMVHFVCHGHFSPDQGGLLLTDVHSTNENPSWRDCVGVQQLTSFLTQIGASSVGFSMLPQNFSIPGLRLLADQLARWQPGSILLHDVVEDQEHDALTQAYNFLYNNSQTSPPISRALTLYCHPDHYSSIHKDKFKEKPWRTLSSIAQSLIQAEEIDQALIVAMRFEDVGQRIEILNNVAQVFAQMGEQQRALETILRILAMIEQIEDVYQRQKGQLEIIQVLIELSMFDRARAVAMQIGDPYQRVCSLGKITQALAQIGKQKEALEVVEQMLTTTNAIEDDFERAQTRCLVSSTLTELKMFDQALAVADEIEYPYEQAGELGKIIQALIEHSQLDQALSATMQIKDMLQQAWALKRVALALAQAGERQKALEVISRIQIIVMEYPSAFQQEQILKEVSLALAELKMFDQALAILDEMEDPVLYVLALNELLPVLVRAKEKQKLLEAVTRELKVGQTDIFHRMRVPTEIIQALIDLKMFDQVLPVIGQLESAEQRVGALQTALQALARIGLRRRAEKVLLQMLVAITRIQDPTQRERALRDAVQPLIELKMFDHALTIVVEIESAGLRAQALNEVIQGLVQKGKMRKVPEVLRQILTAIEEIEDTYQRQQRQLETLQVLLKQRMFDEALAIATHLEDVNQRVSSLGEVAQAIAQTKGWEVALEMLPQLLATVTRIQDTFQREKALAELVRVLAKLSMFDHASAITASIMDVAQRAILQGEIILTLCRTGEHARALELADVALTTASKIEDVNQRTEVLNSTAQVLAQAKLFDQALTAIEWALSGPTSGLLKQYTLAHGITFAMLRGTGNTPAWIAASQRFLEQMTAHYLVPEPTTDDQRTMQKEAEEALSYLSGLVSRHARPLKDQ
jgi:tetratricopeptide (TPR) repeat protein